MKLLDEKGIGTVWSICKEKFALVGHTHNSLTAVSSEQISATTYGSGLHFKPYYNSGGPTTYGNILEYTSTNTGGGQLAMEWTSSQKKSDGTDSYVGRVYYRSKGDNVNGWTKWMTLAYTNDIPTKLSQLTNDKGFVTGSVSGNTVTINGASTTWTNTWRGIQDNLTSTSTSDSLSANQGRVLKGLIDSKVDSSDLFSYAQKSDAIKNISIEKMSGLNTQLFIQTIRANSVIDTFPIYRVDHQTDGLMSVEDKAKLDGIASGANNYTLPTASVNTLGGIKVSGTIDNIDSSKYWPILVNSDGVVSTSIGGLNRDSFYNTISNIIINDNNYSTTYSSTSIKKQNKSSDTSILFNFPLKSGTLALVSDTSNLCRFNFVNSVAECKSSRINFLIFNEGYTINIDPLNDITDGTILLIFTKVDVNIKNGSKKWYHGEISINRGENFILSSGKLFLITVIEGAVHAFSIY